MPTLLRSTIRSNLATKYICILTALSAATLHAQDETVNGNLTVSGTTTGRNIFLTSNSGTNRGVAIKSAGADRWYLFATNTAESGGSVGTDLALTRFSDGGAASTVFTASRATGNIAFGSTTASTSSSTGALTVVGGVGVGGAGYFGGALNTASGVTAQGGLLLDQTPSLSINGETSAAVRITAPGPWARGYGFINSSNQSLALFGAKGTGDALDYAYIGSSYGSPWIAAKANGNVGIGTINPQARLHVAGSVIAENTLPLFRLNNSKTDVSQGDALGTIEFYTNDASSNTTGIAASVIATATGTYTANQGGASLDFLTRPTGEAQANSILRARVTHTGNLLIGGTSDLGDIGGGLKVFSTTPSTTTTSGALQVAGGVGVAGASYFGNNLTVAGSLTVAGTFSAPSYTSSSGSVTGGASGLNLSAGGSGNQNVTLTPTGTGSAVVDGRTLTLKNDNGTSNGLLSQILVNREAFDPTGNAAAIQFYRGGNTAEGSIAFSTNPGPSTGQQPIERMRITEYGSVGIGTATPTARLSVVGSYPNLTSPQLSVDGGSGASIGLYASGVLKGRLRTDSAGSVALESQGAGGIDFNWNGGSGNTTFWNGSATALMTVAQSGNVGIGTNNPLRALHLYAANGYTESLWEAGAVNSASDGRIWRFGTNPEGGFALQAMKGDLVGGITVMGFLPNGNVGIGTSSPSHKLAVNGTIRAKEIIVDTGWADYVFEKGYRLAPLAEVEAHIETNGHLPGIPSAAQVAAEGVGMGEMQTKLLAKIEELTLHLIAQEKRMQRIEKENEELRSEIRHSPR